MNYKTSLTRRLNFWWIFLVGGITLVLLSLVFFINPLAGLRGISVFIGIATFILGFGQMIFAATNRKRIHSWGWVFTSGFIDLVVGIFLITTPEISVALLPVLIALWLFLRGAVAISLSIEVKRNNRPNWSWIAFGGLLSIGFAVLAILHPVFTSISFMVLIGISTLFAGIALLLIGFSIRELADELDDMLDDDD